ncbi:MAG TPA: methylase [Deltaproteobacteria bacterium]|nr:methylase [Deltaproteobacteria bacterium]
MQALEAPLLQRRDGLWASAPVVDVGVGARPWTTVELAACVAPLPVIGVDHSADVLRHARAFETPSLSFVSGSFSLPVQHARLVRVMNVLRDGPPEAVEGLHAQLGRSLLVGGLLIEGSCAPDGAAGTAHWLRKTPTGLVREGLLLWLGGARGLHPMALRERLPRDLLADPGHPIYALLDRWAEAVERLPAGSDRLATAAAFIDRLTPVPIPDGEAYKLAWHGP